MRDHDSGVYTVHYRLDDMALVHMPKTRHCAAGPRGTLELDVKLAGQHIRGSPFKVIVTERKALQQQSVLAVLVCLLCSRLFCLWGC